MTKVGTLKELGVKPGDVVECVRGAYHAKSGVKYTVNQYGGVRSCEQSSIDVSTFRIISRAEETPKLWRDMTPEEKGALLLAYHEGKVIEGRNEDWKVGVWTIAKPNWNNHSAYRIKPERTKSEWSAWFVSKQDGTTKLDLDKCAEVERVALGDGKQFAYRVKKWVE